MKVRQLTKVYYERRTVWQDVPYIEVKVREGGKAAFRWQSGSLNLQGASQIGEKCQFHQRFQGFEWWA